MHLVRAKHRQKIDRMYGRLGIKATGASLGAVADRLRPEDRMTAHTGFLVFARQQDRSADFESRKPMGTRERKQEAARLARLGLAEEGVGATEADIADNDGE